MLIAVCWFVSVTRALRLLPLVIAVHFAGTWFIAGPARHPPFAAFARLPLEQRLRLDMFGALACVMLGYIGFVVFATREERRDLLALVTDGLFEVFDARDRELGLDGIKEALASSASSSDRPLAGIATHLLERVREFGPQLDDQTLLLIRFR